MAYDPKKGYDPNKDYSLAIKNSTSEAEKAKLRQERQNKIDAQYGGKDPYKGTSDIMGTGRKPSSGGSTSRPASGTGSRPSSGSGGSGGYTPPKQSTGGSLDLGRNYSQEAIDAAARGQWDAVYNALNNRQQKIDTQGGNDRGKSNQQFLDELMKQYGSSGTVSQSEGDYLGAYNPSKGLGSLGVRKDLAGKSVKQGHYTITYGENGRARRAVQDEGASANYTPGTSHANDSILHQAAYQAAKAGDWDKAYGYINQIAETYGKRYDDGTFDMGIANLYGQELQDQFKYNAEDYYNGLYDKAFGQGSSAIYDATGGAIKSYQDLVNAVGPDRAQQILTKQNQGGLGGLQGGDYYGGDYTGGDYYGGSGGYGGDMGSFEDFMDSMGYGDMSDATRAAIQAAVDKAVNGYRDQIAGVNSDTDEMARQAYIAKMLGQKNLDQQLSANGYAGGMADSQRIATETTYQNNLNSIEKQRLDTVKELESAITNAQLTGDMQTAQELSGYLQQLQGQWQSWMMNQQQMQQQDYWNQKRMDNDNYWNQQSLDRQNQATDREYVMSLLGAGIMPDSGTLAKAGMTPAEAQGIRSYYLGSTGVQAGTYSPGGVTGQDVVTQQTPRTPGGGYNNGGLSTEQVKQLQQMVGATPDGMWGANSRGKANGLSANEAWDKYFGSPGAGTEAQKLFETLSANYRRGMSEGAMTSIIQSYIDSGRITAADADWIAASLGWG